MADRSPDRGRLWLLTAVRGLAFYAVGSFLELLILTMRTRRDMPISSPAAADLLGKFGILLLASVLFGVSFLIFRAKGLPSAAKRLIHILIIFVSVILILFSLTHGSSLSMQELVLGYFAFSILYLLIYGVCMLARFLIRRKKNGQS